MNVNGHCIDNPTHLLAQCPRCQKTYADPPCGELHAAFGDMLATLTARKLARRPAITRTR